MTKKVLITGGTGYLGSHLIKSFVKKNFVIYALVRPQSNLLKLPLSVKPVLLEEISKIDKVDFFVHTATAYGRKSESKELIFQSNKTLPLKILKKIAHEDLVVVNADTSLPKGFNAYATSKKEFVEVIEKDFNYLKFINMICEQFYGPSDGTFISFVSRNLREEKYVELTNGLQKRDFIYIDDVVSAFNIVMTKSGELPIGVSNFEVGSGVALTIKEIGQLICKIMSKDQNFLKWGVRPMREGEVMLSIANNSKLRDLGWSPKISLEEGLKVTLEEK